MVSNELGVRFRSLISQWIAPFPRSPRVANHPPCTPHAYVFVRVAVCGRVRDRWDLGRSTGSNQEGRHYGEQ
jgi:hypothetical protein